MGAIRKMTSVSTLGLVDFRSDKERIARSTRKTSKEARQQTELMQQQVAMQQQQIDMQAKQAAAQSAPPQGPPPGWYPDQNGQQRYWNGQGWQ